jgi:hypothetical protein
MTTENPGDVDYDPGIHDLLHDSRGNLIDSDYIDKVNFEAEVGYDLDDLVPARIGRSPLSEAGDSPAGPIPPPRSNPDRSGGARRP